jgi:hypothetical protein
MPASPVFNAPQSFRGDYSFRNSAAAIARFPFPFTSDAFMYSMNLQPHIRTTTPVFEAAFDIDEHYLSEHAERAATLEADPSRCQLHPAMKNAAWDTLALLMERLAADYPAHFSLAKQGAAWRWENRALALTQNFTFGDCATLPCNPLEYITRQTQGDFILLGQRDDNLFLDGGMLTSPADWSLTEKFGMSFHEFHAPVPLAHGLRVFDLALKFLRRMPADKPMRRLNWGLTVNPRIDLAPETKPIWGPEKATLTPANIGHKLCLRVELQTLHRLAPSAAILFGIRTYLLRFEELATRPDWVRRLHAVLATLHPDLLRYKAIAPYHRLALDYLASRGSTS